MALAGVLTALFKLDTKDAEKSAQKLQRTLGKELEGSLNRMGRSAGVAGNILGKMGPAGIAASAGIGAMAVAVGASVKNVINLGVELTTLRDKTKLSLGFLQEMKFVAEQTNVPFDRVADAAVRLGRRTAAELPEAVKWIEAVGLNVQDILNLSPEQQFLKVADAIKQIKSPAEQSAAAMGIFGDAGLQILPVIRADVEALRDEFDELGGKISDETLEAGRRFDDSMTSLKATLSGLAGEAVAPLIEGLADLADGFVQTQRAAKKFSEGFDIGNADPVIDRLSREFAAIAGPGIQSDADAKRLDEIRTQLKLRREVLENIKEVEDAIRRKGETERSVDFAADKEREKALAEAEKYRAKIEEWTSAYAIAQRAAEKYWDSVREDAEEFASIIGDIESIQSSEGGGGIPAGALDVGIFGMGGDAATREGLAAVRAGIGDIKSETEKVTQAQRDYNDALQTANALAQLIGGSVGSLVGQTMAAAAALQNLASTGGLSGAFAAGKGTSSGFMGFLGGLGGVASAVGPLVGLAQSAVKAIASIFSKGPDLVRDAARDLGATITKEMADAIEKSGRPLQLAIADIFRAGGFDSIDKFAEEIGDIFSGLDRGEFSEPEAIRALKESLPLLIQHFNELGPAGEEQIERIIAAAERYGIELAELDQLQQAAFAPKTVEEMAAAFGLTNDEVRALAERLEIDVQTNLEKIAASIGLTAEELKTLGAAMEEQLGIPAEQLVEFLEASGLSAAELAEKLGVDVGEGASAVAEAQERANERLEEGVILAERLERALQGAAAASGGINIPGGNLPGHAAGTVTSGPEVAMIGERGPEVVTPVSALFGQFANLVASKVQGGGGGGDAMTARLEQLIQNLPSNVERAVTSGIQRTIT